MSDTNKIDDMINNADEPAPELEGEVRDGKEELETKAEPDTGDMPDSSGNKQDDGPGRVAKLMQKIGIGGSKKEEAEEKAKGEDIPSEFTDLARAGGWDDETISEFAANLSNEELLELIPFLQEQKEEPEKVPAKHEDKSEATSKSETEPTNKELAELRKELTELKTKFSEVDEARDAQQQQNVLTTVNKAFDEAEKTFKVFGKTEELLKYPTGPKKGQVVPTSPAFKARSEVWGKAQAFINSGVSADEAMEDALTWYKGKYLEKDVHRNLLKDLKKHETKLSAKRTGKETVKTYEDEDERKADVVREAARKAGVKGSFDL